MHVLSVSSLKGGVGKTTVTLGLTSAAFARGLSTLVVDIDPQSDVSTGLDVSVEGKLNIADVLAAPKEKVVRSAIAPSGWTRGRPGKIDVLIGSPSAINFDGPHPSIRDIWKLEEALAHVESEYDLVLIDCAPSLNALTRTAWAASDRVTVITEPGLFSVAAADRALRAIEEIRRGLSPRLQPLGIIVNRVRTQSLEHQFRIKELRDMFGPLLLSPQLQERTSLQQTQGAAKPLHMWPGESARDMANNFDQLLDRVIRAGHIPVATSGLAEPHDGTPDPADYTPPQPQQPFFSEQQSPPQQQPPQQPQQQPQYPPPAPQQQPQQQPQYPPPTPPQPQYPQQQPSQPQPQYPQQQPPQFGQAAQFPGQPGQFAGQPPQGQPRDPYYPPQAPPQPQFSQNPDYPAGVSGRRSGEQPPVPQGQQYSGEQPRVPQGQQYSGEQPRVPQGQQYSGEQPRVPPQPQYPQQPPQADESAQNDEGKGFPFQF